MTNTLKLSYENMLYLALGLLSIFIIYKLFKINKINNKNDNMDMDMNMEEGFQSIINKFKNIRNQNTNTRKSTDKIKKITKNKKGSKVSFDDLITETEDMDPSRYTVDNIKNNFFTYLESFQKAKFKNVSGTTDEALEQIGFFKNKFFEIFK